MRRAIGQVLRIVRFGIGELVLRMEACDLQYAIKVECLHQRIGMVEEIVVVQKLAQHLRMHQQGGVDLCGGCVAQQSQFLAELFQQRAFRAGVADHDPHLLPGVDRFGERAQVEPDHRAFQPAADIKLDLRVIHFSRGGPARAQVSRENYRTAAVARIPGCAAAPSRPAGHRASCR